MSNLQQVNPAAFSFYLKERVLETLSSVSVTRENEEFSYLANQVFLTNPAVIEVMVNRTTFGDSITISKDAGESWTQEEKQTLHALVNELVAEYGGLFQEENLKVADYQPQTSLEQRVKNRLDTEINPAVAQHGGAFKLLGIIEEKGDLVDYGDVSVDATGQCRTCSSSIGATLEGLKGLLTPDFNAESVGREKPIELRHIISPAKGSMPEVKV